MKKKKKRERLESEVRENEGGKEVHKGGGMLTSPR